MIISLSRPLSGPCPAHGRAHSPAAVRSWAGPLPWAAVFLERNEVETDENAAPPQPGPPEETGTRTPRAGRVSYSRRVVPPGSSAMREFLLTVVSALEVKPPTEARDLAAYRYLVVARARAVRHTARRLLDDREADDEDVMIAVWALRDQLHDLTPTYDEHPLAS